VERTMARSIALKTVRPIEILVDVSPWKACCVCLLDALYGGRLPLVIEQSHGMKDFSTMIYLKVEQNE
jgi:hypothetical protein